MKKLIATLFVATLGFGLVTMADPTYDLKNGATGSAPILEPVQFNSDYIFYQPSTDLTMDYTVQNSINRKLQNVDGSYYNGTGKTRYDLARVMFSANQDTYLALWTDVDHKPTNELRIDSTLTVTDYGIYFLDEDVIEGEKRIHTYHSLLESGINVTAGREFGVYYKGDTTYKVVNETYNMNGDREDTVGEYYTTTDNWVGSYDGYKDDNHSIDSTWFADMKVKSSDAFFCLFQGPYADGKSAFLEWDHFEFAFATGEYASGQPLPGTLATILIGGLCAGALRKKARNNA